MIQSLAIIAPNRFQKEELVYVRGFDGSEGQSPASPAPDGDDDVNDPLFGYGSNTMECFGFGPEDIITGNNGGENGPLWNQCTIAHQFRLLSAIEAFDTAASCIGNRMYAGFICASDAYRFYGWRTSTRVKIIISVEDDIPPSDDERNDAREVTIQNILKQIHAKYVEYTLNPFSSKVGRIDSQRFHDSIERIATLTADVIGE